MQIFLCFFAKKSDFSCIYQNKFVNLYAFSRSATRSHTVVPCAIKAKRASALRKNEAIHLVFSGCCAE